MALYSLIGLSFITTVLPKLIDFLFRHQKSNNKLYFLIFLKKFISTVQDVERTLLATVEFSRQRLTIRSPDV